jgi:hypothetical protein
MSPHLRVAQEYAVASDAVTPLVVDAQNFLREYFLPVEEVSDDADPWMMLRVMEDRVRGFL